MVSDFLFEKLHKRQKRSVSLGDFQASAVLVPVFLKENAEHLLFTVRNQKVRHHKGEICFPGGVFDPEDQTLERTALRESFEELGIFEKDVEVLGLLDEMVTPTFYHISPFVARIPYPYPFRINFDEIDEILEIPLAYFSDPKRLHFKTVDLFEEKIQVPFYDWKHHLIWGATAKMVKQLVEIVKG